MNYFLIKWFNIITSILVSYFTISAQNPSFEPFKGNVYAIPAKKATKGYIPEVLTYTILGEIMLDSLMIPDRDDDIPFPGVDRDQLYGMILHSIMTIPEEGCYEFTLSSDDGSILWINDVEIVNNDGYHGMKTQVDSAYLNRGEYPLRILYYQAFPTRYGIQFSSRKVSKSENCLPLLRPQKQLVLPGGLLFKTNSAKISENGRLRMDSIFHHIPIEKILSIHISGHTDDVGDKDYNLKLSRERADSTVDLLKTILLNEKIDYFSEGFGESNPLVPNIDEENRKKNRRVEIIIKY